MSQGTLEAKVTPRAGVGGVSRRLGSQPCTIAYMGASVTGQADGYRPRLHEAIRRRFAQDHRSIAAAVGAVGAVPAVFLMDQLVLPHEPDLCIVEYSTGDLVSGTPLDELSAAVEGIVGKLREIGCAPCFLHLYRADWNRRCDEVVAAWEEVAYRHGVPSIDAGATLRNAIARRQVSEDSVIRDSIHTTEEGSELVAHLVDEGLAQVISDSDHFDGAPTSTADAPAGGDDFRAARVIPASVTDADCEASTHSFRLQVPYVQVGVGCPVRRTLPGELLGLVVVRGPDSGEIRVVSEGAEQSVMLWDRWCWYQRLGAAVLERRCPAGAEVTIELLDTPIDYSRSHREIERPDQITKSLRLSGYMVLG